MALFALAFFTKQSFVSAPAALCMVLLTRGRAGEAAAIVVGLCATIVAGTLWLQALTDGGYLANTFGALVGGADLRNLTASLGYSAAWQWGALLALVLFVSRGEIRVGFAELYVVFSWVLNVGANHDGQGGVETSGG